MIERAKYWTAVLYPENLIEDWQENIGKLLQLPYAYCIHDKDDGRKEHIHLILAYNNTNTIAHTMNILQRLEREGQRAFNKIEAVINIRFMYDYLIHDTEDCRKKKKHLYDASERITGNNFDIGAYEQLSSKEKTDIAKKLCDVIVEQGFYNFADFYGYVIQNGSAEDFEILKTYSGLFERLTRGNYQKSILKDRYFLTDNPAWQPKG